MFAWEIRDRLLMDGMPANKVNFCAIYSIVMQ